MIVSRRTITIDVTAPGMGDDELDAAAEQISLAVDAGIDAIRDTVEAITDGVTLVVDR